MLMIALLMLGGLLPSAPLTKADAGQGMCVIGERKLSAIRGIVQLPNKIPIDDALVELREAKNQDKVIATLKADQSGRFQFSNVKPGKYVIFASYPTLVKLYVPIRLVSGRSKHKQQELVITLEGLVNDPCGGGSVILQDIKDRDSQ